MATRIATLARWLGPWAGVTATPAGIAADDRVYAGLRVRVYRALARRPSGQTFLVAPGLHYAGADDPRLDRFCRILAAAGHVVVAPFVPDYLALAPTARACDDFARAFDALPALVGDAAPPVVFSISFGSLLALTLAARAGAGVARTIVFGGYRDLRTTLAFALAGERRDPLNQPVVLTNLLGCLEPPCTGADRDALAAAWRRYVEATWGRPELKDPARYVPIAERLAADVPPHLRALFLVGTNVQPGAHDLAMRALARFDARALDPGAAIARIRGRVDLVHGTDDDVIPYTESHALAADLRAAGADVRLHVTGMYGHTAARLPSPRAVVGEVATLARVLAAMA